MERMERSTPCGRADFDGCLGMDCTVVFSWGNLGLNLIPGGILWVIQAVMRRNMPAKPNGLYGYRTPRSMASQAAWDYANQRAVDLMAWGSWPTLAAAVPCALYLDAEVAQGVLYGAMTVFCLVPLMVVERELARGNYKQDVPGKFGGG
jgi:hypothetical protein